MTSPRPVTYRNKPNQRKEHGPAARRTPPPPLRLHHLPSSSFPTPRVPPPTRANRSSKQAEEIPWPPSSHELRPDRRKFLRPLFDRAVGRYQARFPLLWRNRGESLVLLGGSIARLATGNAAAAELSGDRAAAVAGVVWADGFCVPRWGGGVDRAQHARRYL